MQINENDIAACSSPALLSINKVQPHPLQQTALARTSQTKKPVIGKKYSWNVVCVLPITCETQRTAKG